MLVGIGGFTEEVLAAEGEPEIVVGFRAGISGEIIAIELDRAFVIAGFSGLAGEVIGDAGVSGSALVGLFVYPIQFVLASQLLEIIAGVDGGGIIAGLEVEGAEHGV
ncbi:MAG: hypothetical protein RI897_2168 [Verrucomicrobiota bacterium]